MKRSWLILAGSMLLAVAVIARAGRVRRPHLPPSRYLSGDITAVDPQHRTLSVKLGVDPRVAALPVELASQGLEIRLGDRELAPDEIRPGDHATIRVNDRGKAQSIRLSRAPEPPPPTPEEPDEEEEPAEDSESP